MLRRDAKINTDKNIHLQPNYFTRKQGTQEDMSNIASTRNFQNYECLWGNDINRLMRNIVKKGMSGFTWQNTWHICMTFISQPTTLHDTFAWHSYIYHNLPHPHFMTYLHDIYITTYHIAWHICMTHLHDIYITTYHIAWHICMTYNLPHLLHQSRYHITYLYTYNNILLLSICTATVEFLCSVVPDLLCS